MRIKICVGTMCHLMGSNEILSLAREFAEKHPDKIEISAATCLEYCHLGKKPPIILLDDEIIENVTPEEFTKLVGEKLK